MNVYMYFDMDVCIYIFIINICLHTKNMFVIMHLDENVNLELTEPLTP
jgi:hypothetical protein